MEILHSTAGSGLFPSALRLDLNSHDAEQMREQAAFWSYEHKQFGRGEFYGKIIAIHTRRLQLSLSTRAPGIFIRGAAPMGTTMISFPLSPHQFLYYRGQAMEESQAMTLKHDEEIELQTSARSVLLTVAVCADFFERSSVAVTGKPFDGLRHQERLLMNPDEYGRRTGHLVSLLYQLHRAQYRLEAWEEELVEKEVVETILTGVRSPGTVNKKVPERINFAGKAENYIQENLKNPPSIGELSRIVGISERSLHRSFKERFGVSPKAYVQIMRLNGVRGDLLGRTGGKSVSDTAMEWGFYHLGRFSRQYNRMFGELPSTTTRKRISS